MQKTREHYIIEMAVELYAATPGKAQYLTDKTETDTIARIDAAIAIAFLFYDRLKTCGLIQEEN